MVYIIIIKRETVEMIGVFPQPAGSSRQRLEWLKVENPQSCAFLDLALVVHEIKNPRSEQ